MRPSRNAIIAWLAIYAVTLSGSIWGIITARDWIVDSVGDEQSAADWETWKQEATAENNREDAPVRRRLSDGPESHEPPSLVLMRDHFAKIVGFGLLIGTLLFAFGAFVVHGILFTPSPQIDEPSDDDQPRVRVAEESSPG